MTRDRDEELSRDEQEQRIRELKQQAEEAVGGDMLSVEFDVPGAPPGLREQFWRDVLAWEKAPWTSQFERLRKEGFDLPPPEQLDDRALSSKLWELVDALAKRNVFLGRTDHLSDRQLYAQLYHETLHEPTKDIPPSPNAFCTIDMRDEDSDQDAELLSHFHVDDEQRPPSSKPSFDRDRRLPKAGPFADGETLTDEP